MQGWSINLFRLFGIRLAVHATFLLLLAWAGYEAWAAGGGAVGVAWNLAVVLAFFGCVVLHELGHALTARRYGVNTPRILLMPIGGMAQLDRIPRQPSAEFLITLAGPAVNFAIVAALAPFYWRDLLSDEPVAMFGATNFALNLLVANAVMGTFNLLPVFPMDGGRIFRALLASRLPYLQATWWAATVGKVLAAIFAALAAFWLERPLLFVLFLFIFLAADAEYRQVLRQEQEARYWEEYHRRLALAASSRPGEPPIIIIHGRN